MSKATIVVGLAFGDEGKGSIVDYLARKEKTNVVVRFNGGGQAAHNVVTPDGRHHTFSQFGSATFIDGVKTFLSQYHLFDPVALLNEEKHLREVGVHNALDRLYVHENARVVTVLHKMINKLKEQERGADRHGSCGMGIGETMFCDTYHNETTIYAKDLQTQDVLESKIYNLAEFYERHYPNFFNDYFLESVIQELLEKSIVVQYATLKELIKKDGNLIFEGAQGVLLDELYGFAPYNTWSTTTTKNAETLLKEINYGGEVKKIGVLRSYFTRHGPGPFPTESNYLNLPEPHNGFSEWQREFRQGYFDCVLARYALSVSPVDSLAITHLDIPHELYLCNKYRTGGCAEVSDICFSSIPEKLTNFLLDIRPMCDKLSSQSRYLYRIEDFLKTPISISSKGPTALDKYAADHSTHNF